MTVDSVASKCTSIISPVALDKTIRSRFVMLDTGRITVRLGKHREGSSCRSPRADWTTIALRLSEQMKLRQCWSLLPTMMESVEPPRERALPCHAGLPTTQTRLSHGYSWLLFST